MRKYVNGKSYDLEKSELLETLPDGIQVYRKRGNTAGIVFMYNPKGKTLKEQYFELPPEDQVKYMSENADDFVAKTRTLTFDPQDIVRIKKLALSVGMAMTRFIMMLVDEYEKRQRPR